MPLLANSPLNENTYEISLNNRLEDIKRLSHTENINLHDEKGLTAVYYAYKNRYTSIVEYLIHKDCSLNKADKTLDMVRIPFERRISDKTCVLENYLYNDVIGIIIKY
jgi:ankyrin repeat protein